MAEQDRELQQKEEEEEEEESPELAPASHLGDLGLALGGLVFAIVVIVVGALLQVR